MAQRTNEAAAGKVVSIHYTLTADDGTVLDSSGQEPLAYLHGHENIMPGLERQIAGHVPGDKFQAVVPPEEGYGNRHPDAQRSVPRDAFPGDVEVTPGMQFAVQSPDGGVVPLWVVGIEDDQVQVDLNHPLAGETLTFQVEVTDVRDATTEEQTHGHVHGADGAQD